MKQHLTILLLTALSLNVTAEIPNSGSKYPVSEPIKSIPLPPMGERWVLNEQFSDEFDGQELNTNKWLYTHPTWIGRPPALFIKENVAVEDGNLVLGCSKMRGDTVVHAYGRDITFNMGGAAVVSKTEEAHFGYYECRFKANKTTMSTTFWLSPRRGGFVVEGDNQPDWMPQGTSFSQELDICETIGRGGDFPGARMSYGMNFNTHCNFTLKGKERETMTIKGEPGFKRADGSIPSDDYNVYGCWWRDKKGANFYFNNGEPAVINFTDKKGHPFYQPYSMGVNMVVETYGDWIDLPSDEELTDPSKNKSYYDWVRHYVLKPADEPKVGAEPTVMFGEKIHFGEKPRMVKLIENKLQFNLTYTANQDREIDIQIIDKSNNVVASNLITAYGGYANQLYTVDAPIKKGETYHVVAYIRPMDANNNSGAYEGDSFTFECQ